MHLFITFLSSQPCILDHQYTSYLTHLIFFFFFFNDTATTEIYTLSLHDALPISASMRFLETPTRTVPHFWPFTRSEEHTSELQSQFHLVCRLLLEKKKNQIISKFIKKNKKNYHLELDLITKK